MSHEVTFYQRYCGSEGAADHARHVQVPFLQRHNERKSKAKKLSSLEAHANDEAYDEGMKLIRLVARVLLGGALAYAGISHLTFSRAEFQAQVPVWLPLDSDFVVVASGVVEILLGLSLLSWGKLVPFAGLAAALFFIAIFPGNINQYVEGIDAFGLDTDQARLARLFFQPLLVIWALWSTRALSLLGARRSRSRHSD
jgi:uncharacterized membrane protein